MLIQNVNGNAQQVASQSTANSHAVQNVAPDVAANATTVAEASNHPSQSQLQKAVENINNSLLRGNTNLQFSIDQESHRTVVKVIESKSGDVIKQFPSKEAIAISQSIDNIQKGLLVKQQV